MGVLKKTKEIGYSLSYCENCISIHCNQCYFSLSNTKPPTHFVHKNDAKPKEDKPLIYFEVLAKEIGQLVDKKNAAYGNSFKDAPKILEILYPDGVKPEQYQDMLTIVRILDKLKRIATDKDALGESPYADIVGYGLLGLDMKKPL